MPPPSLKWPELTTSAEISGTTQDCILNTHIDATTLYRHLKANKIQVPTPIIQFLQNAAKATDFALRNPLGADWRTAVSELKAEIIDLWKDVKAYTANTTSTMTANQIASYAQAAARAPPPGHASSNGTSTPGVTPAEL
jgi:hypothetical protein